jgi:hypothetical protein
MKLPKDYLSYSALDLWRKDRDQFRLRYYENVRPVDTQYTLFGSEIHKLVENGELNILEHPREKYTSEVRVHVEIEGVPILGYIDLLNEETKAFSDIKTGLPKQDGSPRWNSVEVQKLDQLPFYSLLLRQLHGKVQKTCKLVWLPTEWEEWTDTMEFDGVILQSDTKRRLKLTGEQHVFKRVIGDWEHDRMREWIVTSAKEISEDFTLYEQNNKGRHQRAL